MATKQAKGVTKTEILNAGMALFLSKGIKVTVKDVADAAGVSRQMVYQYFHSRSGLLIALAQQVDETSGCKEQFYQAIQTAEPTQRVCACLSIWFDYVEDILALATELIRSRPTDPDAETTYIDRTNSIKVWLSDLFLSLENSKALKKNTDINDAVDLTFTIISPQVYDLLCNDQEWSHRKIVDHLSKIVIETFVE